MTRKYEQLKLWTRKFSPHFIFFFETLFSLNPHYWQSSFLAPKKLIEVSNSPIHGNGVFAKTKIPKGTFVCEYKGEIIDAREMESREALRLKKSPNVPIFTFQIDDENFIDATNVVEGNVARFINHSCDENCEARWNAEEKRMEIFTTREILPGEELFLDYGFGLAGFFERPCHCGSKNCCGFVVAKILRPELLRKLARHKRER